MSYTDLEAIFARIEEDELRRLTTHSNQEVELMRVESAIKGACAEIDSILSVKYPIPLSPVPDLVASIATDIAIYILYSTASHDDVPAARIRRYEDGIRILTEVSEGVRELAGVSGSGQVLEGKADSAQITGDRRIFTRQKMGGW